MLVISFLLFKEDLFGWKIIKYCSFEHKLQVLLPGLYSLAIANIFQLMLNCNPLSFRSHMYELRVVSADLCLRLKLDLWLLYRSLKVTLDIPT